MGVLGPAVPGPVVCNNDVARGNVSVLLKMSIGVVHADAVTGTVNGTNVLNDLSTTTKKHGDN